MRRTSARDFAVASRACRRPLGALSGAMAIFALTLPLAVIAAVMAWLITYDELRRHYSSAREPAAEATRRALVVLLFFVALAAGVAVLTGGF